MVFSGNGRKQSQICGAATGSVFCEANFCSACSIGAGSLASAVRDSNSRSVQAGRLRRMAADSLCAGIFHPADSDLGLFRDGPLLDSFFPSVLRCYLHRGATDSVASPEFPQCGRGSGSERS